VNFYPGFEDMETVIRTGNLEGFFKRGREFAKLAAERTITYEDPEEPAHILTTAKIARFRAIKAHPDSITDIAARLKRDRNAVKRDIDDLEYAGLVSVEERPLPGHGRQDHPNRGWGQTAAAGAR